MISLKHKLFARTRLRLLGFAPGTSLNYSDKQHSICLAVERQLPGIPHQLCQYHYLKDLAKPVCEADRQFRKELKKQVRKIRPIEVAVQQSGDNWEAQIAHLSRDSNFCCSSSTRFMELFGSTETRNF